MIRAGGAFVEITAKDNTKAGLDSAKKNLEETSKAAKQVGGPPTPAAAAALNTETIKAQELARRGAKITLENRTAVEKYRDSQKELNAMLAVGAINQVTFARQTAKAAAEMKAAAAAGGGSQVGGALGKFALGKAGVGGGEVAGALGIGRLGMAGLAAGGAALAFGTAYKSIFDQATEMADADRARAAAAQGRLLSTQQATAFRTGGRPALLRLQAEREGREQTARGAMQSEFDRRNRFQTLGGLADPFSIGVDAILGQTESFKSLKAAADLAAKSTEDVAAQLNQMTAATADAIKAYKFGTQTLGMTPDRAAVAQMEADKLPAKQIAEFRQAVADREAKAAAMAREDRDKAAAKLAGGLYESTRRGTETLDLAPQAAAIVGLRHQLTDAGQSPAMIAAALQLQGMAGAADVRAREALAHQDIAEQFARRRMELKEERALEAAAQPLREQAFRGQLGVTGGYDYGGGGQWQQDLTNSSRELLDTQKTALEEQRAHKAAAQEAAKTLSQIKSVFTFG
jgi:hypothetical protein